jgi:hypothetical protein
MKDKILGFWNNGFYQTGVNPLCVDWIQLAQDRVYLK